MREIRSSGSAEGVMSNHDPYSDYDYMYSLYSRRAKNTIRFGRRGSVSVALRLL